MQSLDGHDDAVARESGRTDLDALEPSARQKQDKETMGKEGGICRGAGGLTGALCHEGVIKRGQQH